MTIRSTMRSRRKLLLFMATLLPLLPPAAIAQTQVQDDMSNPLPGVLVRRLQPSLLQMPPSDDQWTTIGTTGKDGRFASEQATTHSFYILSKPGFATLALDAQKSAEPAVNLLKAAELTGVVLDDHGTSVAGALLGPFHPMLQLPERGAEAPPISDAGAPVWTTTDQHGRFRIDGLQPGLQGFLVQAPGYTPHIAVRPAGLETSVTVSVTGTTWSGQLLGSRDHLPQPDIYVEAVSGPLRIQTKSDSGGRFSFSCLPGEDWQFRTAASPTDTPKAALLSKKRRSFKGNELTVLHNQGVRLAGEVHTPSTKAPIAGVQLHLDAFQGEDPLTTITDMSGRFEFANADAFRSLTLHFDDFVCRTPQNTYWSEVPIDTMRGDDITTLSFNLLSRVKMSGVVVGPGKRAVSGASVEFKLRSTREPGFRDFIGRVKYQVKADAAGSFEATLFPPGVFEVSATATSLSAGKLTYDASTSPVETLHIDLKPNSLVRGRTLDAAGQPLPDCRVELSSVTPDTATSVQVHLADSTRSGPTGQFSFEGAFPPQLRLIATHQSSDDVLTTDVIMGQTTGPIDLQFSAGQLFTAIVADDAGSPVKNATVQVYTDLGKDNDSSESRLLVRRTNDDGHAAFGLTARRIVKVIARHKDFAPFSAGPVALPNDHFDIRLNRNPGIAATITGTPAVQEDKRQIWLLRAEGDITDDPVSAFFQSVRREESRDGHAMFANLRPGWYKVSTTNGSVYGETEAVQVLPDSGILKVDIPLATGATLKGRVTDEKSGEAVPGAQVTVQLPCCTPQGFESDPVSTDADGHYELAGLPAGAMLLMLKHSAYSERAQHVVIPSTGEKTINLKLGHGSSTLSGRVTLDGKPLANAAVYIYRPANRSEYAESAVTGIDGKYVIETIPEGNHVLEVQSLWGAEQVELRRTQEIRVKGRTATADINFDNLVHVSGRLRMNPDEEGPNPHNTLWFSRRASPDDLGQTFRNAQINSDGDYDIYLEPGSYVIGLQEGAGLPFEIPSASAALVANFELRDLAEASGIKLVPTGAPVVPREVPDNQGL